jgi:hypothetical protein
MHMAYKYLAYTRGGQFLYKRPDGHYAFVKNTAETIPDPIEGWRVPLKFSDQIVIHILQSYLHNRDHHFC